MQTQPDSPYLRRPVRDEATARREVMEKRVEYHRLQAGIARACGWCLDYAHHEAERAKAQRQLEGE